MDSISVSWTADLGSIPDFPKIYLFFKNFSYKKFLPSDFVFDHLLYLYHLLAAFLLNLLLPLILIILSSDSPSGPQECYASEAGFRTTRACSSASPSSCSPNLRKAARQEARSSSRMRRSNTQASRLKTSARAPQATHDRLQATINCTLSREL